MEEPGDELVRETFLAALKRHGPERDAFLRGACGNDAALRGRVSELLCAHDRVGAFLETPVAGSPELILPTVLPISEQAGDTIGPYKLLEEIGEGGCGVVYMAEQTEPIRRRVALKVLKLGMDTREVIARFEAERQALALMDHPNIAKVLDAGATATGRPYFVMELVRGIKITDYCDENRLSTDARLGLFVQVCHAIQHAHQKGIIHRDIKPSNILVTINDGVAVPKVIDFGIAKATGGQQLTDKTVFTAFQQFIGTPAYMSPEQAVMTSLDIDTRSDIYALGVLLYELLTGHTPFEQKELMSAGLEAMRQIIREREPARPSTRLSTLAAAEQTTVAQRRRAEPPQLIHRLRGDLDWIVMKCLEKDRTRRYDTANTVAADIGHYLNQEPVSAAAPGKLYRTGKFVRRHKVGLAMVSVATALLVGGVVVSTWQAVRATRAERAQTALLRQAEEARARAEALQKNAELEASRSAQISGFLQQMLGGIEPSVALGRDTKLLQEILDKTAERLGRDLTNQPEVEAELRSTIGSVHFKLGQYSNAASMHRRALELRRGLWGNLNTNVANSLTALGLALVATPQLEEVERAWLEALSIRTNLLGAEDVQVAVSLSCLGRLRMQQGRMVESEEFFGRALAMRRKLLGNEHPDVARILDWLCILYNAEGRVAESERAAREGVAILARNPESNPPQTNANNFLLCSLKMRLGISLKGQGKYGEAERVARECLEYYRKILPPEHMLVVEALGDLSTVLDEGGKLDQAQTVAREAVTLSQKAFGIQYPTPFCLNALGDTLHNAGKFSEAESAFREAWAMWLQQSSTYSWLETATLWNLIHLLQEQNKLPELEQFFRESIAAQQKVTSPLGRQREATLLARWASVLRNQGKLAEAEPFYRQSLDLRRQWATNDPATITCLIELGTLCRSLGRLKDALPLHEEAYQRAQSLLERTHPTRLMAMNSLASAYREAGRPLEALPLHEQTLALRISALGPNSEATLFTMGDLAGTYRALGRLEDAIALYERGLPMALGAAAERVAVLKPELRKGIEALIKLYEETNQPDKVAEWRKKLAQWDAAKK